MIGSRFPRMVQALLALAASAAPGCGSTQEGMKPLRTVDSVDLDRYLGTWYEIARYPNSFQRNCQATTATYSLRSDGDIDVVNACHEGSPDGPRKTAEGKAWVVDEQTGAKLKVRFFWPFSGDYWIIDLGSDYEYAVVGHPERTYFWILSRTPALEQGVIDGILARAEEQGYDRTELIWTEHAVSE